MYAVFTEVDIPNGVPTDGAGAASRATAVPTLHAVWTQAVCERARGQRSGSAPDGVIYRTVELREVSAQL